MEKAGLFDNVELVEEFNFRGIGVDVRELTISELSVLPRYTRFEKEFAFYKMDVSGFGMHLTAAVTNLHEKELAWAILSEIDQDNPNNNQLNHTPKNL